MTRGIGTKDGVPGAATQGRIAIGPRLFDGAGVDLEEQARCLAPDCRRLAGIEWLAQCLVFAQAARFLGGVDDQRVAPFCCFFGFLIAPE